MQLQTPLLLVQTSIQDVNELASKPIKVAPESSHGEINFLVDVVGGKYRIFDEGMNKFVGEGNSPDGIAPKLEFVPGHTYRFLHSDGTDDNQRKSSIVDFSN